MSSISFHPPLLLVKDLLFSGQMVSYLGYTVTQTHQTLGYGGNMAQP